TASRILALHFDRLERRCFHRTPARDGIGGENGECDPDEAESQHLSAAKRLVKGEDAEEKRAARREILQKTHRSQAKMARRMGEPKKRQASYNSGADQEQI